MSVAENIGGGGRDRRSSDRHSGPKTRGIAYRYLQSWRGGSERRPPVGIAAHSAAKGPRHQPAAIAMKLGYTEFSFGYAFTENLIRSQPAAPLGAPVFPNLVQEGAHGYDVRIDLPAQPLYFQYKLPEILVRDTAREIATLHLAGIETPFFRMALMRSDHSCQHQLLIKLESDFPNSVYYAAPLMEDVGSFNAAYSRAEVHEKTIFFSPQAIGPLPDHKQHVIAYRNGLSYGWFLSEPNELPARSFGDVVEDLARGFKEPRYRTLARAAKSVRDGVRHFLPPHLLDVESAMREGIRGGRRITPGEQDRSSAEREVIEDLLFSREIARVALGLDLLIAQPSSA